jgi:hypothetical protein
MTDRRFPPLWSVEEIGAEPARLKNRLTPLPVTDAIGLA